MMDPPLPDPGLEILTVDMAEDDEVPAKEGGNAGAPAGAENKFLTPTPPLTIGTVLDTLPRKKNGTLLSGIYLPMHVWVFSEHPQHQQPAGHSLQEGGSHIKQRVPWQVERDEGLCKESWWSWRLLQGKQGAEAVRGVSLARRDT